MIGIYKITNPKGKVYIGSSSDIKRRFRQYKSKQAKKHPKLYNSFIKYGIENHIFEILEECKVSFLLEREFYYAQLYNVLGKTGLNCSIPKKGISFSYKSEEVKDKIRKKRIGKKHSEESKKLMGFKTREGFKTGNRKKRKEFIIKNKFKVRIISQITGEIIEFDSVLECCSFFKCNPSTISKYKNKIYKNFKIECYGKQN